MVLEKTNAALNFWGISGVNDPRITFILTDNGSNMIKAYSEAKGQVFDSNESMLQTENGEEAVSCDDHESDA